MNFVYPVPSAYRTAITSGLKFGVTRTTTDPPHVHGGVDLAWGHAGAAVLAAAAGTVAAVTTTSALGGPGIVYVDHGDGWQTRYMHLAANPPVSTGQVVNTGDVIGETANLASGPHLHFEVLKDGTRIDPETVLGVGGGILGALLIGALGYWLWRRS